MITNVVVNDTTGVINVTVSASINSAPACKSLYGGTTITGTWSGSDVSWTFTPTTPAEILDDSWIIVLP